MGQYNSIINAENVNLTRNLISVNEVFSYIPKLHVQIKCLKQKQFAPEAMVILGIWFHD